MKRFFVKIIMLFLILTTSSTPLKSSEPNRPSQNDLIRRFSLSQLQEDYEQFVRLVNLVLTPNKPYADHQEITKLLNKQSQLLYNNMGELEFFRVINPVLMQFHCGHTYPILSREYHDFVQKNGHFLPFTVKVIDNKIYVYSSLETQIPKGSEIISINNIASKEIIKILLENMAADGVNTTFKFAKINNNFNFIFHEFIDLPSSFSISFNHSQDGRLHNINLPAINLEQLNNNIAKYLPITEKDKAPYYGEIFDNYAILRVKTFKFTTKKLESEYLDFISTFFKELSDKKIINLILDLRNNIGGRTVSAGNLYAYLIQEANPYLSINSYSDETSPMRAEWMLSLKKPIQPAQNNFKGNLYILVNGGSFSATGMLCSLLKYHQIGKFIGEETGGSYLGMAPDNSLTTLENTQIQIPNTCRRFETKVSGLTPGRGIFPDYPVTPSLEDYLHGNDVEMEFAIELINQNQ